MNGEYVLYNPKSKQSPLFVQCDYASKGKWSIVERNLIQITSENYYLEQAGYKYSIEGERKYSDDSLYIVLKLPDNVPPLKMTLNFNHQAGKSVTSLNNFIALPKLKDYSNKIRETNFISLALEADVSGENIYRSRVTFKIFEKYINTNDSNYLTVVLPNFDNCFYEFEPIANELLYIKNNNQIYWKGEIWSRID
jgi:hypothetical protein